MSDKVECPFCGELFAPFVACSLAEHPKSFSSECPVQGQQFTIEMWNMRPPKKECSDIPKIQSEVEWLRLMVEKFVGELK